MCDDFIIIECSSVIYKRKKSTWRDTYSLFIVSLNCVKGQ